jgi:serine/threonine protein kinase KIN1/2
VTNPPARAPLLEVLNHPWMTRGFNGPPDPHLVHREPLRSDELDRLVIRGMKGFEFGMEEDIEKKLTDILDSESYQRSVQYWERKRGATNGRISANGKHWQESLSSTSLTYDGANRAEMTASPSKKSKRFSGFDFYRRKLFSPASSPPSTPLSQSPPNSQSHLTLNDQREPADPTYGFHPLISIYFLSREKLERERVYGPGHFASSQLSLHPPLAIHHPTPRPDEPTPPPTASIKQLSHSIVKTAALEPTSAKADYTMHLPRLPAPETSHYSGMSFEPTAATPSPTSPTHHPQPRARDSLGLTLPKRTEVSPPSGTASDAGTPYVAPSTPTRASILPRAPPASTHRRSHSLSQRPTASRGWGVFSAAPHVVSVVDEYGTLEPSTDKTLLEQPKSTGIDNTALDEKLGSRQTGEEYGPELEKRPITPTSPLSPGATLVRKFGTLLSGRGDESRRSGMHGKRTSILGGFTPRPSAEIEHEKEKVDMDEEKKQVLAGPVMENEKEQTVERTPVSSPVPVLSHSQSQHLPTAHRRATTIIDSQGRANRHERRSSTGAQIIAAGGSIGRHRRPSTGIITHNRPIVDKFFGRTDEEDENAMLDDNIDNKVNGHRKTHEEVPQDDKDFKPLFLKGLFRSVK